MHQFSYKIFDIRVTVILLIVSLLPSFVFVSYHSSSLALGMLVSSAIIFVLNYNVLKNVQFNKSLIVIFIFTSVFLLIQSIYAYINASLTKPLYSLVIVFVVLSALVLASNIKNLCFKSLSQSVLTAIIVLLLLGWLSVFYDVGCCNYAQYSKSVFPFSEPSHYALTVGILSVAFATVGSFLWVLFTVANLFFLAMIFPSLTLLVFALLTILSGLLRIKPVYFKSIILIFPLFVFFVLFGLLSDSVYFSSRLDIESTTNASVLVYLQGWDLAYMNFIETNGKGLGFQMLGSSFTKESQYSRYLMSSDGLISNISDGGFLASKIIVEFGAVGVLLLLGYLFFILRFMFFANKIWSVIRLDVNDECQESLKKKFLLSGVILGFFVEIFIRGYGYFSPGVFLFLAAGFYLINNPIISDEGIELDREEL